MIEITINQAILILIDHYQANPKKNKKKIEQLKQVYIDGIKDTSTKNQIFKLISKESDLFQDKKILTDSQSITKDPTRRYFETILAHNLKEKLLPNEKLSIITEKYKDNIIKIVKNMAEKPNHNPDTKDLELQFYLQCIQDLINGARLPQIPEAHKHHAFNRLFAEAYELLASVRGTKSLEDFILSAYLPIFCAPIMSLPLAIYGKGIYSEEERGLIKDFNIDKSDPEYLANRTYGILERSMPAPATLISEHTYKMKPTGRAYFKEDAKWPKKNFEELTHPFVASISGTMLVHLRMLLYQLQNGEIKFKDTNELKEYLTRYISILLYQVGGHSLREFTGVFELPETIKEFSVYFKDFNKEINLIKLFKEQLSDVLNKSIDEAIKYNKKTLATKEVNYQISALKETREKLIKLNPSILELILIEEFKKDASKIKSKSVMFNALKESNLDHSFFENYVKCMEESYKKTNTNVSGFSKVLFFLNKNYKAIEPFLTEEQKERCLEISKNLNNSVYGSPKGPFMQRLKSLLSHLKKDEDKEKLKVDLPISPK
ncbi:TPA: hypothetical protein ACTXXA_003473 [Legionella anisa]